MLDASGSGTDSQVIAAIQRAISLKSTWNIQVLNLSLGRPVYESYTVDPLCQAVEAAWNAGITVVVAAGNDGRNNSMGTNGYATITAPGNDPYVITVGSMKTAASVTTSDDTIASYSSKGPTLFDHVVKPDLVAPGNRIYSVVDPSGFLYGAYPANQLSYSAYAKAPYPTTASNYYMLSGTSMAAAVTSGASAALIGANPGITPDTVKARLMKTAGKPFPPSSQATVTDSNGVQTTYVSQYDMFTIGAGYLNISAAVNNFDVPSLPAISPVATFDSNGNVVVVNALSAVWGSSAVGAARLFGVLRSGSTAVPRCGEAQPFGVPRPCGAVPPYGAAPRCGARPQCGEVRQSGAAARKPARKVSTSP